MAFDDLKVYTLSSVGLLFSLTDLHELLQVIVLIVTGIPAAWKCFDFIKKKYEDNRKL